MMSSFSSQLKNLSVNRYIELKQQAYDICMELERPMDFEKISDFVVKRLHYPLDSVEGMVLSSTLLYPYDAKICDDYLSVNKDETSLKKMYFPIMGKIIPDKIAEIESQKLDLLLGQGILDAPVFDDKITENFRK